MDLAQDAPANLKMNKEQRECWFTFQQIAPRLIEQDDVINYDGSLKMDLAQGAGMEWFAPALGTVVWRGDSPDLTLNS